MSAEQQHRKNEPRGHGVSLSDDCWFHTRATVNLLYVAICQIETSIAESNQSVQQLTDTFTQLAEQSLREPKPEQTQSDVWTSTEMRSRINQAITAFQFYDRINQRLQHVSNGLEKMSMMFNDINKLNDPESWQQIEQEVEASYSMNCERMLFQKIMSGASVEEAMASYKASLSEQPEEKKPDDDIELF